MMDKILPHRSHYYTVNAITLYRLLAAPVLLLLLLNGQLILFKWLLAVSFLTDAIDGYLETLRALAASADSAALKSEAMDAARALQ